ncbi:MAG: PAS domain S-box protein [Blastocatellia bacterium]|nr:PAS domain S-box protein [Blastocatellia bacterium]
MSRQKSQRTEGQAESKPSAEAEFWHIRNLFTVVPDGRPFDHEQEIIEKAALAASRLLDLSCEPSADPSISDSVAETMAAMQLLAEKNEQLVEEFMVERALLETLLSQTLSGIIIAEAAEGKILFANLQSELLWGRSDLQSSVRDELGHRRGLHKDGSLYKLEEWPLARTLSTGEAITDQEIDILRGDGTRGTIKVNSMPVRDRQGHTIAAMEMAFDFTNLKQAEEQIRELTEMLDESEDAIFVREISGRVLFWNRGAERMFGWTVEEATGRNIRELLYIKTPSGPLQLNATIFDGYENVTELRLTTKDGNEVIVEKKWSLICDEAGKPKAVLVIMADITKTKKIEAQLFRLQRLDSIGAFAAGMAHDLGNALAPILMAVQLLRNKVADESAQRHLTTIQNNVKRSVDLIKRVLGFVRGAEDKRITLQLQPLIYEIEKMLKGTLPKSIVLEISIEEGLWSAIGNVVQMHQVIMNLCVNARDAMPEGGRLLVAAENVQLDETEAQAIKDAWPGQYVSIRVADTGTGIPARILGNIFDPFFTTKRENEGTGLGLAMVANIVNDHKGFIDVTSEVGKGTEFRIYIPATEAMQESPVEQPSLELPTGHGELILVADDEAAVQEITKEVLEAFGYRTLTASDGMEAVMIYSRHGAVSAYSQQKDRIRVVLADMIMPYLNGLETIRAIRRINPDVKIVAMSGTPADIEFAETVEPLIDRFLLKPYTARKLLETLAEVLAED